MSSNQEPPLDQCHEPAQLESALINVFHAAVNQNLNTLYFHNLEKSARLAEIQRLSPSALAYIGDAVYELYVRVFFLSPPRKLGIYHQLVVAQVCAEAQALHLQKLLPHLQEEEKDIIRRGRNAANTRHKRVHAETYQQASGLETLIGYLYLTDTERLTELLQKLHLD